MNKSNAFIANPAAILPNAAAPVKSSPPNPVKPPTPIQPATNTFRSQQP